jgi:hypothetical protein
MRTCFLGQSICALGFGVATLQTPPLLVDERTGKPMGDDAPEKDGDKPARPQPTLEPPQIGISPP